jgi:hypothetical protein
LSKARSSVLGQAYSFTSAPIAKALVEAHRRGAKGEVIFDKTLSERTFPGYENRIADLVQGYPAPVPVTGGNTNTMRAPLRCFLAVA